MIKYISMLILVAFLFGCSMNDVNNLDKKNSSEHAELLNKIKQYQREDSLKIAQVQKDIVLYRQALLKTLNDLDVLAHREAFSLIGPDVQNAINESDSLKLQALAVVKQKLTNVKSMLKSYTSDAFFTPKPEFNTISYSEVIAEMDSEIRDIQKYLNSLDSTLGEDILTKKEQIENNTPIERKASKPDKAKPVKVETPAEETTPEAQQAYDNARVFYDNQDYDEAVSLFQDFLAKYPKQPLAANATYWLGESYYSNEEYNDAIKEFKNVVWKYPDSNKAPDAQFKLGLSYLKKGDSQQAKLELLKVKHKYPNYERMNQVDNYLSSLK